MFFIPKCPFKALFDAIIRRLIYYINQFFLPDLLEIIARFFLCSLDESAEDEILFYP